MYALLLPYPIARDIAQEAKDNYPEEVCGILGGQDNKVSAYFPIANIAKSPQTRYEMQANSLLKALKKMDEQNLDWIAIYHSHPTSPPILSQTDIAEAVDTKPVYLIISLQQSKPQFKAWRIADTEIIPVDVHIGDKLPDSIYHEPLSNQQKAAIIVASILCVIVMLAISITLLPPAPVITPIP